MVMLKMPSAVKAFLSAVNTRSMESILGSFTSKLSKASKRPFSRSSSWGVGTLPGDEDARPLVSPSLTASDECSFEAVEAEPSQPPRVDSTLLQAADRLAPEPSKPSREWDGLTCLLTACPVPRTQCCKTHEEDPVAAYRAACQQLAWAKGSLWTYAAVLH